MMGDAGRRSRSTGSVQDIFESLNRRLPNRGGFDADSRRQKRLQLVQNVMNEGPASCKDCAELREKHMAEKRKYFMEVGHLRRAVNKLLDQCANFMSSTSFHKFKETLQLEVRYLTEHGDEEVMSRSPSSGRTSPGSPKMGMSYGRMEERINMLEEQNAKLEKQNKRLIEELSKQGKSTIRVGDLGRLGGISIPGNADSPPGGSSIGGSPISGMSPTSKGRRNSLATPGSASTKPAQTQTDPFPTGSRGASVSGGFHQPSNSGPSHIAYQAAQAGQGALVINGEIGSLQGDVVERAEFDRVTAERDLHRMKLTASEKKVAELSNIKAALEKQLLEHTSDKSTKEASVDLSKDLEEANARIATLEGQLVNLGFQPVPPGITLQDVQSGRANVRAKPVAGGHVGAQGGRQLLTPAGIEDGGSTSGSPSSRAHRSKGAAATGGKSGAGAARAGRAGVSLNSAGHPGDGGIGGGVEMSSQNGEGGMSSDRRWTDEGEPGTQEFKVEMVDKCVGGGPGPSLNQDPLRCRGRACSQVPSSLNNTGRCYIKEARSVPNLVGSDTLSATQLGGFGVTSPTLGGAKSSSPKAFSKTQPAAGNTWPVFDFAGSSATRVTPLQDLGRTATEAEPYLLRIWEHESPGGRQPAQKALAKLGATVLSPSMRSPTGAAMARSHSEAPLGINLQAQPSLEHGHTWTPAQAAAAAATGTLGSENRLFHSP